ncbi:hypothetical protein D3C73_1489340 [compost metagenome]
MLSSILPEPETALNLLMLPAAQKANGMQSRVEMNVPKMEIASVSSRPRSKSSPSGK